MCRDENIQESEFATASSSTYNQDPEFGFSWLDTIDEDDCFMALRLSTPTPFKTLDFGHNGYTASLSAWHELLQFTVPDHQQGILFIRGDFPNSAESILARAQRRNEKGTWGMEMIIKDDDKYVLEETPAQGMINLRWPCTRFNIVKPDAFDGSSTTVGTHTLCSFVKDEALYQISRIVPSKPLGSDISISLSDSQQDSTPTGLNITVGIGGVVHVGSAITNFEITGVAPEPSYDTYNVLEPAEYGNDYVLAFTSKIHGRRLEMRLWMNGQPIRLTPRDRGSAKRRLLRPSSKNSTQHHDEIVDIFALQPTTMGEDLENAITAVAEYRFVWDENPMVLEQQTQISSREVRDYLGVTETSISAPYRFWSTVMGHSPGPDCFELNAVGRSIEQVLCISSVPVSMKLIRPSQQSSPTQNLESAEPSISVESDSAGQRDGPAIAPQSALDSSSAAENPYTEDTSQNTCDSSGDMGTALIQNIISSHVVDLSSTFWQLRLLVKAIKYVDGHQNLPPYPVIDDTKRSHFEKMRLGYRELLLARLRGICQWVFNIAPHLQRREFQNPLLGILPSDVLPVDQDLRRDARFQNSKSGPKEDYRKRVRQLQERRPKDQKWYCALIIWYIMHQYGEVLEDRKLRADMWICLSSLEAIQNDDIYSGSGTNTIDDARIYFLRWYHSHSFINICKSLERDDPEAYESHGFASKSLLHHKKWAESWQAKTERTMRLFEKGGLTYESLDYDIGYLALLIHELGIPEEPLSKRGVSCIESCKNILNRCKKTTVLSPGRSNVVRWDPGHTIRSAMPRPAPWELSCLGHHITLCMGVTSNPDQCLRDCQEFLLADYTFMSSWDQSKTNSVAEWWNMDTSSIICANLLDEGLIGLHSDGSRLGDIRNASCGNLAGRSEQAIDTNTPFTRVEWSIPGTRQQSMSKASRTVQFDDQRLISNVKEDPAILLERILERWSDKSILNDESMGYTWRKRKPQKFYHADTSVQSLEDTPRVFELKQTRKVQIRPNIQAYLNDKDGRKLPNWTLKSITQELPGTKLLHISCFDLSLIAEGNNTPEIGIAAQKGRADREFPQIPIPKIGGRPEETKKDSSLALLYLLGKVNHHPRFTTLTRGLREELEDEPARKHALAKYQNSLFSILNDSMVDLGTKYRIIFIEKISRSILQAMIYMWHTDALDTIDDHLGVLSKFSDLHNQSSTAQSDLWITSITVSHWRLQNDYETYLSRVEELEEQDEGGSDVKDCCVNEADVGQIWIGDTTAFPPKNVKDERAAEESGQHQLSSIRELSMSIVITGDGEGRCWTCSVISEVIDEIEAAVYANEIKDILQMFIHQQYTGRMLCFILLLGYLCESLAKQCENFTGELDKIMGMNPKVLLKGIEWHKSDIALRRLKKMLWGLEALRVFDDKLKQALSKINEGKTAMYEGLKRGTDIRHRDMKRDCENIKQEFTKRLSRLENAHSSIRERIEQSSRLREGITSVLTVEQNENISMLTWVTIAYLPLAFIAGVFGMGHNIVPPGASWGTFGWLISVFVLGTVIFALSLQLIIARMRHMEKMFDKLIAKESRKTRVVQDNVVEKRSSFRTVRNAFGVGLRKRMGIWKNEGDAV